MDPQNCFDADPASQHDAYPHFYLMQTAIVNKTTNFRQYGKIVTRVEALK
jgi:hypothetical protein